MPEWASEGLFPGVFDGFVFDPVVFDCFFTQSPEDGVAGSWIEESSVTSSWTPEASTS